MLYSVPLFLALFSVSTAVSAVDICSLGLRHRIPAEALDLLRGLFPEIRATATGSKILLMASPQQCEQYRQVLKELDRPLRRFRVSFRWESQEGFQRKGARVGGNVSSPRAELSASDSNSQGQSLGSIQVLEGDRAQFMEQGENGNLKFSYQLLGARDQGVRLNLFHGQGTSSSSTSQTTVELPMGQWVPVSGWQGENKSTATEILGAKASKGAFEKKLFIRVEE